MIDKTFQESNGARFRPVETHTPRRRTRTLLSLTSSLLVLRLFARVHKSVSPSTPHSIDYTLLLVSVLLTSRETSLKREREREPHNRPANKVVERRGSIPSRSSSAKAFVELTRRFGQELLEHTHVSSGGPGVRHHPTDTQRWCVVRAV